MYQLKRISDSKIFEILGSYKTDSPIGEVIIYVLKSDEEEFHLTKESIKLYFELYRLEFSLMIKQVLWKIDCRIYYLEECLESAKTVNEVNEINFAISELEELKEDFKELNVDL